MDDHGIWIIWVLYGIVQKCWVYLKIAIPNGKSGTLFPRSSPFFWSPGISQQLGRSHSSLVQIEDLLGEPRKIFLTEALFSVPASLRQLRQRLGIVRVRPIFLRKTMVETMVGSKHVTMLQSEFFKYDTFRH